MPPPRLPGRLPHGAAVGQGVFPDIRRVAICDPHGAPSPIQASDVFVTAEGIVYLTDNNAGLSILEFTP